MFYRRAPLELMRAAGAAICLALVIWFWLDQIDFLRSLRAAPGQTVGEQYWLVVGQGVATSLVSLVLVLYLGFVLITDLMRSR